jgi:hypothetical protein
MSLRLPIKGGVRARVKGTPLLRLKQSLRGFFVSVTTPPEIIPYYRLNHSIWSLSDNKEASR